ncbi:MAG: lysophospholipid acyltransferase family protein [Candidatus Limnocylindrales bacterium]
MVRVVVEGLELVPDAPGVILASNHLSVVDPPLLSVLVARAVGRRVRYMAKAEAMAMPVVGTILRAYGGFAVRRGKADREAYRAARAVLTAGDWLGLAPEGTRSRTAQLGEPKPGVAMLALRTGALVLPVGISGSERTWPIGAHLPRPFTTITVRFGQPYRPGDGLPLQRSAPRRGLEDETEALMYRIAELLPPAYRGRYR